MNAQTSILADPRSKGEAFVETTPLGATAGGTAVTVAYGDGIGPEIMRPTLEILRAAGAHLDLEEVKFGQPGRDGFETGIAPAAWDSLRRTGILFKAPAVSPPAGGNPGLDATLCRALGLFATIRPCASYEPVVATGRAGMDLVIIRETEDDLHAGIEHRQTRQVYQAMKLVSRPGCERIVRYAFDYARAHGRRKVTCFTRDDLLTLTDGLFRSVFEEIGAAYPEIEREHLRADIGAARLADRPELFDVLVMPNLYGDILSEVAAQLTGSFRIGATAHIGATAAIFEAANDAEPLLAGKDKANPSGLLLAGVLMLNHLGQRAVAERVHNAWLRTIEDGVHTFDLYRDGASRQLVGTRAFAEAVIARLGQRPDWLKAADYTTIDARPIGVGEPSAAATVKEIVGIDLSVEWDGSDADLLAERVKPLAGPALRLQMITNRGVKVWPNAPADMLKVDHWRCRFLASKAAGDGLSHRELADLFVRAAENGLDIVETETLCIFDDGPGYTDGQGR